MREKFKWNWLEWYHWNRQSDGTFVLAAVRRCSDIGCRQTFIFTKESHSNDLHRVSMISSDINVASHGDEWKLRESEVQMNRWQYWFCSFHLMSMWYFIWIEKIRGESQPIANYFEFSIGDFGREKMKLVTTHVRLKHVICNKILEHIHVMNGNSENTKTVHESQACVQTLSAKLKR